MLSSYKCDYLYVRKLHWAIPISFTKLSLDMLCNPAAGVLTKFLERCTKGVKKLYRKNPTNSLRNIELTALQEGLQVGAKFGGRVAMEAGDVDDVRQIGDRISHAVVAVLQREWYLHGEISNIGQLVP